MRGGRGESLLAPKGTRTFPVRHNLLIFFFAYVIITRAREAVNAQQRRALDTCCGQDLYHAALIVQSGQAPFPSVEQPVHISGRPTGGWGGGETAIT